MTVFENKHICGMSEEGYKLYKTFIKQLCEIPEEGRYNNGYDVKKAFERALDEVAPSIKEKVNSKSGTYKIGSKSGPNWYYANIDDFVGFTSRLFCEL